MSASGKQQKDINVAAPISDNHSPTHLRLSWWVVSFTVIATGMFGSRLFTYSQHQNNAEDAEQPAEAERQGGTFLAHLLVGLLIFSALLAFADAFRTRWSHDVTETGLTKDVTIKSSTNTTLRNGGNLFRSPPPLQRRFSLVDLTVSRHERKSASNIHQHHHQPISLPESLDPPSLATASTLSGIPRYPRKRNPPLLRHCSSLSIRGGAMGISTMNEISSDPIGSSVLRRTSVDLGSDGDVSPDFRRRNSRLIRRH